MSEVARAPDRESPRLRMGLSLKLALSFIGLVSLVLVINGAVNMWLSYGEAKRAAVLVQQEKAQAAAERIQQFVGEIEQQIGWTTHAQWSAGTIDQRRYDFVRLLRQVPAITELVQIDGAGKEQLKVSRLAMDVVGAGTDLSADPRFAKAVADKIWHSPVYFRKESEPYMTISIVHVGRNAGVTVAEVNLKFIWDVVTSIKVGEAGYAYVVNGEGRLIAHPDISLVLRDTDLSRLPQVADALTALKRHETQSSEVTTATGPTGISVLTAFAAIPHLDWLVFVELPSREALAPVYASLTQTGALLGVGLLLAAIAGTMLARRMTVPIHQLQAGAERLGAGELDHRIDIRTGDEIEALASRFNRMAGQLQDSYATLESKVETRTRDLTESLDRQTATSEVLRAISQSPTDTQPVFDAIAASAQRLCEGDFGVVIRYDGELAHMMALHGGAPDEFAPLLAAFPSKPVGLLAEALEQRTVVHAPDITTDPRSRLRQTVVSAGGRAFVFVPMLREGAAIGAILVMRREPRAFTDTQIELLKTFADQAVIAIENARLLAELQTRNRDLAETLEFQTATAEVLRVVASSPDDLQPVFDAMLNKATQLCEADCGMLQLYDGDEAFTTVAMKNIPAPFAEALSAGPRRVARLAKRTTPSHIPDLLNHPVTLEREKHRVELVELGGARAFLSVPLLRKGELTGVFVIYRREPRPFAENQIALVTTFADQAVIAIENARLISETREALEQQTATAEVLKVISSSPGELKPVFDKVLENALRVCEAKFGVLQLYVDGGFRIGAIHNAPPAFAEAMARREALMRPTPQHPFSRMVTTKVVVQIADLMESPAYKERDPGIVMLVERASARTFLAVPMVKENEVAGVIAIYRQEVRPFTDKQVAVVVNFANQAVIAIENARLLSEIRSRSAELARSVDELTTLREVGQAVSSTLDLGTVLETIVARAVSLAGAEAGAIYRYRRADRQFRLGTSYGFSEGLAAKIRGVSIREEETTALRRAIAEREPVQLPDLEAVPHLPLRDAAVAAGFRSVLIVPLIGADRVFGVLSIQKKTVGEFPESTVRLMQTFATQSVLAIQNARLFREVEEQGRALALASQHKSQFLANMSHELRTPLNAILGYAELLVDGIYGELSERARGVLERVQSNGKHLLGLINDVLDLSKIEAGQLTLAVEDYVMPAVVHSVVSATESLAKAKGLTLATDVPKDLPMASGDERRLTQVILNLVGNAIKFTDKGSVVIAVTCANGRFDLAVTDTGPGIAEADRARIFEEFQQVDNSNTRRKGGTGLGLSISKKIVELHGGTITVESELGKGSTFHVVIPVRVAQEREVA